MSMSRIDYPAIDTEGHTQMVRGTPTEGATLDNEWGIAPLPEGWTEYRNEFGEPTRILIPEASVTISDGAIRDRRPWADASQHRREGP